MSILFPQFHNVDPRNTDDPREIDGWDDLVTFVQHIELTTRDRDSLAYESWGIVQKLLNREKILALHLPNAEPLIGNYKIPYKSKSFSVSIEFGGAFAISHSNRFDEVVHKKIKNAGGFWDGARYQNSNMWYISIAKWRTVRNLINSLTNAN